MMSLNHQNIIRIIEPKCKYRGYYYFSMEYIDGSNLYDFIINNKELSKKNLLNIIEDVCLAVNYSHDYDIIHRDIKPENILVQKNGTACLTDFDLVLMYSSTIRASTGSIGTFMFAAPETIGSTYRIDKRSDIFSLAMTIVFCLYNEDLPINIFGNYINFVGDLDCNPEVKKSLMCALEWEPSDRYNSALNFWKDFNEAWKNDNKQIIKIELNSSNSEFKQYKENSEIKQDNYYIGKYTVTNAEFKRFVLAGGYDSTGLDNWWSNLGKEVWESYINRQQHPCIFEDKRREDFYTDRPAFWDDGKFNHPNKPVVGICWFEAEAYCNWLLEYLIKKDNVFWVNKSIHLPTEFQWVSAARKNGKYEYPWGNKLPSEEYANYGNKLLGTPHIIGSHPKGSSWCGCNDMVGDVWEWSLDNFEKNNDIDKVIRGGCCFDEAEQITINSRQARKPAYRHAAIGFRIVVESKCG